MSEDDIRQFVRKTIKDICSRKGLKFQDLADTVRLDTSGWGLDSLDIAEVSSALEQHFGHDPYSNRVFALTIQDILNYYLSNPSGKEVVLSK